ncbi:MAG: trigger factor, partial [Candidatus Krumholzibacteriia bacterium]
PGFRKGKTPKALVEKELGGTVHYEALDALIQQAWVTALIEHRLRPLTDPAPGGGENLGPGDTGPLRIDLAVEVRPEVEAGDYDGVQVRRRAVLVRDEDVDEVVDRLRESRAAWEAADRPAATGDRLTVDLVPGEGADGPEAGRAIADQRFVLGEQSNMAAFDEALAGAAVGDLREIRVDYPADHPNDRLQGRTIVFACTVKAVEARILPAADDAFAAALEEGKTLAELREAIRADLEREAGRRVAAELDEQILRELVARHDVPLPPSMVERYLDSGLEELHRRNARYGREADAGEDARYREAARPHAEQALRGMLLLEAVRRREGIKVEPAEVDERIEAVARENGFPVDDYRKFVDSGDGSERERLAYDLLERRTYDFLLSRAVIEDVSADTDVLES